MPHTGPVVSPSSPISPSSPPRQPLPDDAAEQVSRDRSARWDFVLSRLARTKRLSVHEVAASLGISESTVRRDFMEMEKAQLARRVHGGLAAMDIAYTLATAPRADELDDERERIAAAAAALVEPGQIVGFNGGRTTSAAARRIVAMPGLDRAGGLPGLTVVCAALNIAIDALLRPSVRTVVLGGVAEPRSFELTGPLAQATMRDLWLDTMFVGALGVDLEAGLSCDSDAEAGVTRTMISHSRRVVGIATGDKIGLRAMAGICPLSALTDLIITGDPPQELREFCTARSTRLHCA